MELFLNGLNNDGIFDGDGDDVVIDDWKYFCNPCELVPVKFLFIYWDGCDGSWIFVFGFNEEEGWGSGDFNGWGEWAFERIYDFMFFDLYWFLVVEMLIP